MAGKSGLSALERSKQRKTIGILALQGDVSLHSRALESLGAGPVVYVRTPAQLSGLDGLVIPGGESTALLKLCELAGLLPAFVNFAKSGKAIFGTCAGAILLAAEVTNPAQQSLGLIDITVERNGYGRQIDSAQVNGQARGPLGRGNLPMIFIRAPRIMASGTGVKVLASYRGEPVLVQQGKIITSTFHPELDDDTRVYRYWLDRV